MSNENNPQQHDQQGEYEPEPRYGSWQPTRQSGEYDADATAFVQLPPEDLADAPLAAPGHGYVPPMILPLTPAAGHDPAAGGGWNARSQPDEQAPRYGSDGSGPSGAVHWPDPNQQSPYAPYEQSGAHHTAQWNFTEGFDGTGAADGTGHGPDTAVHQGGYGPGTTVYGADSGSGYEAAPAHEGYPPYTVPGAYEPPYEGEHGTRGAGDHQGHEGHTGHPDTSGFQDHAGHSDHTGHLDTSGLQDHAGHSDHTGHLDTSGLQDHAGHSDHTGHLDLSDHGDPVGHTGQWTIPVADGELPDESGEFAPSPALTQWYTGATPPATLPGGAPAPWATQDFVVPDPEPQAEAGREAESEPEFRTESQPAPVPMPGAVAVDPEAGAPVELPDGQPVGAGDDPAPAAVVSPVPGDEPGHAPDAETAPQAPDALDVPDAADPADPADSAIAADPADVDPHPAPGEGEVPAESAPAEFAPAESAPEESAPEEFAHGEFVAEGVPLAPEAVPLPSEHPGASYVLHVNGVYRPVSDAWIGESLLYVLRERLGLAGAKDGCSQGECGACNVQVDGRLVASCLVPAATTAGSEVRTVEGLAVDGEPSDVQRALAACGAVQCGFCIPGMAMTVHDLLEGNHAPSELQTRQALCGNLCRCSGYRGVLDAVRDVVASRAASAEAAASSPAGTTDAPEARIPHQAPPGAGGVQGPPHPGDAR
ncbi:2Fe-2S iron-sulfur cluster-binding protein [Streptomyces sp. NPDC060198]|uniref:2Fe-2S iron-sulfur cluster-binding protein n=1 Tax=Streptomyces sp. NPDC060198 TaxID=3347070 RepID=UPI0036531876